jgi:hypothetical protein
MTKANRQPAAPQLRSRRLAPVLIATGGMFFVAGCSDEDVQVHQVPKGVEPVATPSGEQAATESRPSAASSAYEAAPASDTPWTVPPAWRESSEVVSMRLATLIIPREDGDVEVAISRFAGEVGGMLANVNRWRGQIGLPPVAAEDLPSLIDSFEAPGFKGSFLHLEGPQNHMLVASLFEPAADRTWFVRVVSSPEGARAVREEVLEFARSFSAEPGR